MEDVFKSAFEYVSIISVPMGVFTIIALADEIFILIRRAVMVGHTRSRRR